MTLFSLLTNLALFAGLGLALGVVAARWWIVPGDRVELRVPAARVGVGAALLVLLALGLVLGRQLVEFHDPFATWSEDLGLLLDTGWGATWKAGVVGGVVLLAAFGLTARGVAAAWPVASVAALAMGAFPALTGHASGGDLRAVTVPADVLHVWAMGAWIGGLAVILALERTRARDTGSGDSLLPVLIPRFSPFGMTSVALLAATGVVGSWVHLGGLAALVGTPYGRWLALKLVLVWGVLALGALNFRRRAPRLGEPGGPGALRRSAALEVALAVVVLAVTAVLVRTPPG